MKKVIFVIILSIFAYLFFKNYTTFTIPEDIPVSTPNQEITDYTLSVEYNDLSYFIFIQEIYDPKKLILIPNFTDSVSSDELMIKNKCLFGINAGFYTKENNPLGLFFTDGKYFEDTINKASLFNGYFYKTENQALALSKNPPTQSLVFAVQSGPLFVPGQKLSIISDERARRMMIGQTDIGTFYFLAITDSENIHSGPYLADLPMIMEKYNTSTSLSTNTSASLNAGIKTTEQFDMLLNLDGGSASAFYDDKGTVLSELTSIGSFFCATP